MQGKRLKPILIACGVIALLGIVAFFVFNRVTAPVAPVAVPAQPIGFVAEGRVIPQEQVALTFAGANSGLIVREVLVKQGDTVVAGQPLARLDTRGLVLQVAQAKAQLAQAQASYDALITEATPAEVAQANAQISQDEAQLTQARGGVTNQDRAAAQAQVVQAQAVLNELQAGAKQTDIVQAQAALDQATANLQSQTDSLSAVKTNARIDQGQASDALVQAQSRYSTAKRNAEHVAATGNDPATGRGLDDVQKAQYTEALIQAEAALRSAETTVDQAGITLDAAKQSEINGLAVAETAVRDAQAKLDALLAGSDTSQRTAARAQLAQAQADLARLSGEQRTGTVEAAAAGVTQAEAALDALVAAPKTADAARAKAQIEQANVAVQSAELALDQATLRAPISARVAEVNITAGELPAAQTAIVLASTTWKIETTDLTELQIVKIKVGDKASISFDALPTVTLGGTVQTIETIGQTSKGNIVYTVGLGLDAPDERLRWNMTAVALFTE